MHLGSNMCKNQKNIQEVRFRKGKQSEIVVVPIKQFEDFFVEKLKNDMNLRKIVFPNKF